MNKVLLTSMTLLFSDISGAQTCDMFVGGYIPSYRNPTTVDYSKLSHVFYAFASTNPAGDLLVDNVTSTFSSFETAAVGKQRFLSLAGGGGHESYSSMTASPSAIQAFANNCVAFCQANNLQGIDMDWEGITTVQDSVKFGNLTRALSSALHSQNLLLVITLSYGAYGGDHYNMGALKKADWIQLMVYDQTGSWNASPYGNHASHQHILDAINYWTGRGYTDLSRIVIGLPFYGYKFNSTAGGLATAITYANIVSANPNLACNQDDVGLTFFNGPEMIRRKVDYAQERGLKGVMIWELGQDLQSTHTKSLLRAVSLAACNLLPACDLIVSVAQEESTLHRIEIMHNPVNESLEISLGELCNQVSGIALADLTGRVFYRKEDAFGESIESINVSGQPAGFYLLVVTLRDQKRVVKRFVKT